MSKWSTTDLSVIALHLESASISKLSRKKSLMNAFFSLLSLKNVV